MAQAARDRGRRHPGPGASTGCSRWALSGATRTALKAQPGLLEDLRDAPGGGEHDRSMNLWWFTVAGAGLVVLGLSVNAARRPTISPAEARVFHAVNGWPGWLFWIFWAPMQLGNLVVGTIAGLVVALVDGNLTVAIGVVLATLLKLVVERVVRREMADRAGRPPAARYQPGRRHPRGGDVPTSGPSFPSGHVILVAAIGAVVEPVIPAALVVAARRGSRCS